VKAAFGFANDAKKLYIDFYLAAATPISDLIKKNDFKCRVSSRSKPLFKRLEKLPPIILPKQ
jgi:hypothetical protein